MLTVSPSSSSGDVGRGRLGTSSIRAQPARPQLLDRREGGEARRQGGGGGSSLTGLNQWWTSQAGFATEHFPGFPGSLPLLAVSH